MEILALVLMAWLFASGQATLTTLLLNALIIGAAEGLVGISLSVMAGGVVPVRAMASAIGLLLIGVAAGRFAGGTLTGPLVGLLGAAGALLAAAGMVALGALFAVRIGAVRLASAESPPATLDLRPGMRWYRAHPDAITVLAIGMVMSLLVYGYFSLLPLIVAQTMGSDTTSQGVAMALGGLGVAVGAVTMGPLVRRVGVGWVLVGAAILSAAGILGLAAATTLAMTLVVVTILPLFTNVHNSSSSLALQRLAHPGVRGRVLGLYSVAFAALLPVGTVLSGWLGERFGARETLVAFGLAMAACTVLLVVLRPGLLRIAGDPAVGEAGPSPDRPAVLGTD
jgi:predicted MFS family arabinose efflux permease